MKKNNSLLSLLALSALVSLVAACGANNSTITSTTDSPGAGATGANVDIKDCQVGQSYTAQYGCLNRVQCQAGSGYSTQTGSCVSGQLITEQMVFGSDPATRHYGRLTVTNPQQMELMLQSSGLCTSSYYAGAGTLNYAYGNSSVGSCAAWIARGAFAVVKSYSGGTDNINVTIGAGTQFPSDLVTVYPGIYGSQISAINTPISSTNYVSFNQKSHNYPFNNGNGLQIVGMFQHHPLNFDVLVNNGNLGLDHLSDVQIVYQGTQVATVSLDRF